MGLTGRMVDVASYRLAIHLGLAFAILGFILWYWLLLGRSEVELMQARRSKETKLFSMTTGLMHLTFVQILLGALVAGIDRIMDMMRTTTNVSGDAAVATTVASMTGEIDRAEMISADDV